MDGEVWNRWFDWLEDARADQWAVEFPQRLEVYRRLNEKKVQMERDIIYGNDRSEPMDRETFTRIWGDEEGGDDE